MSTRKIIDAKHNGEKVWIKGHAQAIYMSDGATVEDAIKNIKIGGGGGNSGGLDLVVLEDMSPSEIVSNLENNTIGVLLVRDNTSGSNDTRYTIYKTFVPVGKYSFLATKLEWNGSARVNTVGTFSGDNNGHGSFTPLVSEQQGEIKSGETLPVSGDAVYKAIYSVLNTEV